MRLSGAPRYTARGSDALERRIARDLDRCVAAVREALRPVPLRGVVLGGGLGRGEGGLRRGPSGELPYNDYDLFVVLPTLPWAAMALVRRRLGALADRLTGELGVEVELAALPAGDLPRTPPTLMATDLQTGHRVLWGPADLLAPMPPLLHASLAPAEASRLLLNRAALLLMARDALRHPLDDAGAERVARYVRKATLARGDAWLILRGLYVTGTATCRDRLRAEAPPDLARAYASAVEERLSGGEPPGDSVSLAAAVEAEARLLTDAFGEAESRRLGHVWPPFHGDGGYGPIALAAGGTVGPRECLRVARAAGALAALHGSTAWSRCAATLPSLLDGRPTGASPMRTLGTLQVGDLEGGWLALWRASA